MTISSEIVRIKTAIADAYTACQDRGATMPAVMDSDHLDACIQSISVGPVLQHWYNWVAPMSWSTASFTSTSSNYYSIAYVNDLFIATGILSIKYIYSSNGTTWTEGSLPRDGYWYGIAGGDGKYVVVDDDGHAAYSTDGINWTEYSIPQKECHLVYADGKFVGVLRNSNNGIYSIDGQNWTTTNLSSSDYWEKITYGNGLFVALSGYNSNKVIYSPDGQNWTTGTLPSTQNWYGICYGGDKFVAITYNNIYMYSTDGINWTQGTLPLSNRWTGIAYGDGKFIIFGGSSTALSSTDGITWTQIQVPYSSQQSSGYTAIAYGNNKFVAISNGYNNVTYSSQPSVYTLDQNPTTSSVVYDLPDTPSALTITGVGTGTITLSDSNTYTYNASGDIVQ